MPERYKPEKEGKGVNVFWFDAGGAGKAKAFMSDLFGDGAKSPLLLDVESRAASENT